MERRPGLGARVECSVLVHARLGHWSTPRDAYRARRPRCSDRQARHGNTAGARAKRGQASNTQRAAHRARRPRCGDRQARHGNTAGARAKRGQASITQRAALRARRPRRSDRQAGHGNTTGAHAKHAQGEGGPVGEDADEMGWLGLLVSCYREGTRTGRARAPGGRGRAHREGVPTGRACPPGGRERCMLLV